jgi:dUTP pyrophosphatase
MLPPLSSGGTEKTDRMGGHAVVRVCSSTEGLALPAYATPGSAGMDLACSADIVIAPGAVAIVPTGLRFVCPEGMEVQIRPRSGLAARHAVTVLNSPGTVDSDFRGEVKVLLINHGSEPFEAPRGTRIAQAVFARYERVELSPCSMLDFDGAVTERGSGGFGSTGR